MTNISVQFSGCTPITKQSWMNTLTTSNQSSLHLINMPKLSTTTTNQQPGSSFMSGMISPLPTQTSSVTLHTVTSVWKEPPMLPSTRQVANPKPALGTNHMVPKSVETSTPKKEAVANYADSDTPARVAKGTIPITNVPKSQ